MSDNYQFHLLHGGWENYLEEVRGYCPGHHRTWRLLMMIIIPVGHRSSPGSLWFSYHHEKYVWSRCGWFNCGKCLEETVSSFVMGLPMEFWVFETWGWFIKVIVDIHSITKLMFLEIRERLVSSESYYWTHQDSDTYPRVDMCP